MGDQAASQLVGTSGIKQAFHTSDAAIEVLSADVRVEIPAESGQRRINRVPPQLRKNKDQDIYDPVVVPLGPYHHGQPQYHHVEKFKDEMLNMFSTASEVQDEGYFRGKILKRIDQIRSYYEGVEYNDEDLAEVILRDACFLIYCMRMELGREQKMALRLGLSTYAFLVHDFYMLENQIPLWVVRLLLDLRFGKDEGEVLLSKFISRILFGEDNRLSALPWEDKGHEPLHLLEACRTTIVTQDSAKLKTPGLLPRIFRWKKGSTSNSNHDDTQSIFELKNLPFRSATDLRRKGIYCVPSSYCLKDIKFTSYFFHGILKLPIRPVNNKTTVFFSNIIAYEMSPDTATDHVVRSYVNFMKSLIQNPKDVKELRQRGILLSTIGNDEAVVKVFKEIDTHGESNWSIFADVKVQIEDHCNNKAKTWMATFILTNFRTPCTFIALFAATLMLVLTFLQTFYTIRQVN